MYTDVSLKKLGNIEGYRRTRVHNSCKMILKFIRNLVVCSNHYPGVSHRTFGFRTLPNEKHEFDTVHAAIKPNRTNKK